MRERSVMVQALLGTGDLIVYGDRGELLTQDAMTENPSLVEQAVVSAYWEAGAKGIF